MQGVGRCLNVAWRPDAQKRFDQAWRNAPPGARRSFNHQPTTTSLIWITGVWSV